MCGATKRTSRSRGAQEGEWRVLRSRCDHCRDVDGRLSGGKAGVGGVYGDGGARPEHPPRHQQLQPQGVRDAGVRARASQGPHCRLRRAPLLMRTSLAHDAAALIMHVPWLLTHLLTASCAYAGSTRRGWRGGRRRSGRCAPVTPPASRLGPSSTTPSSNSSTSASSCIHLLQLFHDIFRQGFELP